MIDFNDASATGPIRYDLDAIAALLRATAERWVPRLFPNGRRVGDEWRLANIRGAAPRNQGSCVIALRGDHAGDWHDFDGNHGGGPLSAIENRTGQTGRDLFACAAEQAGWSPGQTAPPSAPPAAATAPEQGTAREIAFIVDRSKSLEGSSAASYLRGRGLAIPMCPDLRAHDDLAHWDTKRGYAGLVALVRDRVGEVIALHRTYLDVDPSDPGKVYKAALAKPRKLLGKNAGGSVRLAPIGKNGVLALSEGIESGLAVLTAIPSLGVWATLSTAGLEQAQIPPEATRIIILADNDTSGAGVRAADTAAQRLRLEGREVVVAIPPAVGQDFNDLLREQGADAVRTAIEQSLSPPEPEQPAPVGQHRPVNYIDPVSSLPMFRSDEGDLGQAVERAWSLLLASNRTPWLFRYAGAPTWVVPDDEGRPVAASLTDERLRHMLAKLAIWRRLDRKGDLVSAHPPMPLVKSVLATPDPGLPVLVGIVNTPVYGRNGKLLTSAGYHPDARLLYFPAPNFDVPDVAIKPSVEDCAAARRLLCEDLLGDFPFVSPSELAHAVALLLLGFVRSMIDGPTPLHLIEKPTPGTGATLMVDAIATTLTGTGASVMTEGRDDEEWRKRLTAKLRQVPSIVLIDNLRHKLDSSAVAAALTAPFWEDRILGASEMARMPIRCAWIATGNNPEFSNEMARRIVRIRLDAHVERPWQRDGFRHPDLLTWVRANRARLVSACLTLCQAWIAAGRPRASHTLGSYENWAQVVGGVLEVAGIEGFLGNLDEVLEASDSEGTTWRNFVSAWWDRSGTSEVGANDLYELALSCDPPLPIGAGNDRSQRTRLGKALGRMRDRVFRFEHFGVRILKAGTSHRAQRWRLSIESNASSVNVATNGGTSVENVHLENGQTDQTDGERGERGERFSHPYTRADAHAHAREEADKPSPRSPRSPSDCDNEQNAGERSDERLKASTNVPSEPEWLKEVT